MEICFPALTSVLAKSPLISVWVTVREPVVSCFEENIQRKKLFSKKFFQKVDFFLGFLVFYVYLCSFYSCGLAYCKYHAKPFRCKYTAFIFKNQNPYGTFFVIFC